MTYREFESSLLMKYSKKQLPGRKSYEEVLCFLQEKLNLTVIPLSLDVLDPVYYEMIIYNTLNCIYNEDLKLSEKDLEIKVFNIVKNEQSSIYYQELINSDQLSVNGQLRIIFEKKTGFIQTESSRLFLETRLYQGISSDDIKTKSSKYFDYCSTIDLYKELFETE